MVSTNCNNKTYRVFLFNLFCQSNISVACCANNWTKERFRRYLFLNQTGYTLNALRFVLVWSTLKAFAQKMKYRNRLDGSE